MTAQPVDELANTVQPNPDEAPGGLEWPIVGIGASLGGLEAFSELLQSLPGDAGLSLLYVQHLDPNQRSELPAILTRLASMPVREATDGVKVEPNHVYIVPPNKALALTDGHLQLSPRPPRGVHMPVDHLFRSLAAVQKSRAVAVILSGGGTDGTLGFHAIKAEGGITFAQDEKSARQDGMPRSAIADGSVDYVLPPARIAAELVRLVRHPYTKAPAAPPADGDREDLLHQIIGHVRARTDVDFTHYKRSTITRRIQRRMALRGVERMEDYLRLLKESPGEVRDLHQDFLIRVTQFFRDPEAFDALKQKVFPAIAARHSPEHPIRIWVAGCSTGEEVYSLAMALLEFLDGAAERVPIKILATDLNEEALAKARLGLYVENIEADVAPERLRRFFARVNGHYEIHKAVRDLCVFSRHNMTSDPPFSHLDLVSCRNVLIYLNAALQKRVLPVLHYALSPEGYLFLGSSESVGPFGELLETVDQKQRIFRKKASSRPVPLDLRAYTGREVVGRLGVREEAGPLWSALDVQREADRLVLARYAPVGVVIDERMTVLQFRGRTAPYLEPAPGMASLDLLRMLRKGLLAEVRAAINQARSEQATVVKDLVNLVDDGAAARLIKIEVIPFKVPPTGTRFFLVLFQDVGGGGESRMAAPEEPRLPVIEAPGAQLQQEIAALREYLQSVIEEQETTNEELKSANEEILSANEELQSTNEELQTAKEEAQSANEELATVNEELHHRNAELARVNNDLINLLTGVNIPIVMVSRDLRLRRFTPLAEKVFNLIPTDMGRPISDIKPNIQVEDLAHLIIEVIDSLAPHESEVQDRSGRWYSLRIRPYVTMDNKIDGASIVLLDIHSLKQALEQDGGQRVGDPSPTPPLQGRGDRAKAPPLKRRGPWYCRERSARPQRGGNGQA